ncbi:MAG: hypothetical protein EB078_04660 [Proteobacteria bacterium]|nr:hypothetical protein [Pseudomonadota bacterium]NDC25573.1 hypothetical protein [Pseudomonadota bacterium]NDD04174.1 hypothetical protein [Pseudomonadota bacterium]NDG26692.1 hypothetical protein [Pseudomonadota bacterium]
MSQCADGTHIELTRAAGLFRVWKEKNGLRILNSSGLAASGWQKKLEKTGTSFSDNFLTESQIIGRLAGRVCPPNVFLSYDNMATSGRCLYYDSGNTPQTLTFNWGIDGIDMLYDWSRPTTGRGELSSYYEGNIKVCADKGMRLPVVYETSVAANYYTDTGQLMNANAWKAPAGDPSFAVTWAGPRGVPPGPEGWTWTASAQTDGTSYQQYFRRWFRDKAGIENSSVGSSSIRCVLP